MLYVAQFTNVSRVTTRHALIGLRGAFLLHNCTYYTHVYNVYTINRCKRGLLLLQKIAVGENLHTISRSKTRYKTTLVWKFYHIFYSMDVIKYSVHESKKKKIATSYWLEISALSEIKNAVDVVTRVIALWRCRHTVGCLYIDVLMYTSSFR